MTRKAILALAVTILAVALANQAQARPHKHARQANTVAQHCFYRNTALIVCAGPENRTTEPRRVTDANGNGAGVIGGRPAGCPHAYCGCGASLYLFGRIIPSLNLAANWIREFPRTHPAPGMAAARRHHVMVLISHVGGSDWLVHDSNSGGGKTREHVRSIAGYTIVDPHSRMAGL